YVSFCLFFCYYLASPEIYTLSLHDALPIFSRWLTGFHNFTVKSIAKIEAALGEQIIYTAQESQEEVSKAVHALTIKTPVFERANNPMQTKDFVSAGSMRATTSLYVLQRKTNKEKFSEEVIYIETAS